MDTVRYAIIGGSGLYSMPELTDISQENIDTPFGAPSDAITIGTLHGQRVAFVPRHGRGHRLSPSTVPYRANIFALKTLGVTHVIAVSACGSLQEAMAPGHVVVPDQLYDNTKDERGRSFFGPGLVAHVSVADPFCEHLSGIVADSVEAAGGTVHRGGTFVTIEGPRFSTKAESQVYQHLGFSIIGMTTSPEAYLAREAEMCYAVMAHVTDYDVWHEEVVTTEAVLKQFQANLRLAQQSVMNVIERLAANPPESHYEGSLRTAFVTSLDKMDAATVEKLRPIVGKYL